MSHAKWLCFLCNLGNFLKNVIVFLFGNQIQKEAHLKKKKKLFLTFFQIFSHKGKDTKNPSALIPLTYIQMCFSYHIEFVYLSILKKCVFIINAFSLM